MMYNYPFYPFLEEDTLLTTTDIQVIVTILLKIVLFQIKIILVSVKKIKSREQKWWHAFWNFWTKVTFWWCIINGITILFVQWKSRWPIFVYCTYITTFELVDSEFVSGDEDFWQKHCQKSPSPLTLMNPLTLLIPWLFCLLAQYMHMF